MFLDFFGGFSEMFCDFYYCSGFPSGYRELFVFSILFFYLSELLCWGICPVGVVEGNKGVRSMSIGQSLYIAWINTHNNHCPKHNLRNTLIIWVQHDWLSRQEG